MNIKKQMIFPIIASSCFMVQALQTAQAEDFSKTRTINICLEYHDANADRKAVLQKELKRRGMLSYTDYKGLKTGQVEVNATTCGMYMIKGKPLAEKGKYLRPMVYKVVHIYPKYYFVSQTGIIMQKLERKKGVMPPALDYKPPKVMPPPVLYNAPGGHHQ